MSLPGEEARRREGPGWASSRAGALSFHLGKLSCAEDLRLWRSGWSVAKEKSLFSFPLGWSIGWSDERNISSPKGRVRWLT